MPLYAGKVRPSEAGAPHPSSAKADATFPTSVGKALGKPNGRPARDEQGRPFQGVEKVLLALFRGIALRHLRGGKPPLWPFLRVRKRFCKQNRAKIAAHVADFRFTVCRRRVTPLRSIPFLTGWNGRPARDEQGRPFFMWNDAKPEIRITSSAGCPWFPGRPRRRPPRIALPRG